ncbi:MAG TPA: hypothetical protein VMY88_11685 [Acidimicrobiales bacterium]|nr:hypothetical protein [Acidimicrobiales bacterium]
MTALLTGQLVPILSALEWDPTVRGLLIVVTAIAILPGSVFLLLSTNVGARLGFLLALTAFFGWMTVQGLVWWVFAQGNRGRQPHWEPQEVITGDLLEQTTLEPLASGFPEGWKPLEVGGTVLGDAQASADAVLTPADEAAPAHGAAAEEEHSGARFEAPFDDPFDYILVDAYEKGGESELFFWHAPHHAVIRVAPVKEVTVPEGAPPPTPERDPSKPITSVVLTRDLGNVRLPPFMLFISSGVIFAVLLSILHRRDKEAMAARAAGTALLPAAGGRSGSAVVAS